MATFDEGWAVILAAVFAILGIFYTSRQQRKMLRKQHTFQVLDKLNDWKEFDRCLDKAARMARDGRIPSISRDADRPDCETIDFLLNYYEFLASAIICGDIDEELTRRMERARLCRIYLRFLPYIAENRIDSRSVHLWENLEFMCYRWSFPEEDRFDRLVDTVRLRPTVQHYNFKRDEIAEKLMRLASRS